jgi:hypothetical protein
MCRQQVLHNAELQDSAQELLKDNMVLLIQASRSTSALHALDIVTHPLTRQCPTGTAQRQHHPPDSRFTLALVLHTLGIVAHPFARQCPTGTAQRQHHSLDSRSIPVPLPAHWHSITCPFARHCPTGTAQRQQHPLDSRSTPVLLHA